MTTLRILLVGKIHGADCDWRISPPPEQEQAPQDGEIERLIREGEQTQELIDDVEDRAFWARGEW